MVARLVPRLLAILALSLLLAPAAGCESKCSKSDGDESSTDQGSTGESGTEGTGTDDGDTEGTDAETSSTDASSTGTSSAGTTSTQTGSTSGGVAPEDILACGLETPCAEQPIEASVTGAWTGDDYVEEYRCVVETLLQTVRDGASATPGLLRLGTNLYGDSPTNDDVAVGYEDGTSMYFSHGYENGIGPWEDPHQSCALLPEAQYQACLDSPTIDCIGISALLGSCDEAAPDCP